MFTYNLVFGSLVGIGSLEPIMNFFMPEWSTIYIIIFSF